MKTDTVLKSGSVLTFGEPIVCFAPDSRGKLSIRHQFRPYIGGAELNTAIGLARLGLQVSYGCATGADSFGQMIRQTLRGDGVDTQFLTMDPSAATAMLFKEWASMNGTTSVYYVRSHSPMALGHWTVDPIQSRLQAGEWNWVHSTGITLMLGQTTREKAIKLLRDAKAAGATVSFDVNIRLKLAPIDRWRSTVRECIPFVDWMMLGDEEAKWLYNTEHADEIENYLRTEGFSGRGVIVKRGEQGADMSTEGRVVRVKARSVAKVLDTVGAGDGFNAGFIAGMLSGWPLVKALELGTVVGAFAVTSYGDSDGYPTWVEAVNEINNAGGVSR